MAVLQEVPGIEVAVRIHNQDVTEYSDPHASESNCATEFKCPQVTKYIEAIDNAEFAIRIRVKKDEYAWGEMGHHLVATITVDGTLISRQRISSGKDWNFTVEGTNHQDLNSKLWYIQKPKFAAISKVDDHNLTRVKNDVKTVNNLGVVRVFFERATFLGGKIDNVYIPTTLSTDKVEVAKKALKGKAISHSIVFGQSKTTSAYSCDNLKWKRLPSDNDPIAVFDFVYRSKEGLKQELVIPRTPSPSPIDDMSQADIRRLARERLAQLQHEARIDRKPAVKREADEVVDIDEEANRPSRAKRRAITIDLTAD